MKKIVMIPAVGAALMLSACQPGQMDSKSHVMGTETSQVAIRSTQTRAFDTREQKKTLRTVIATLRRHAELLCADYGELRGCRDIRKHMAWYLKGFSVRQHVRQSLGTVTSLAELDDLLGQIDPEQDFNAEVGSGPRGRTSGERQPALPDRWLESPHMDESAACELREAELAVSGG